MKKYFLTFALVLTAFSLFAERNKRINFAVDFDAGAINSTLDDGSDYNMIGLGFGADAEYMYITPKNWILGAKIGIHTIDRQWFKTIAIGNTASVTYDYNWEGSSFTIAPVVGKAFGQYKNIHILWFPLAFEFADFEKASVSREWEEIASGDIEGSCTNIKTCIYANFQFGKNLVRNGIYTGVDFYLTSAGDIENSHGAQFVIGYKLSFAV